MSKSTDHHAVVEEEFLKLEYVLNQTAGDTSACLKLLKKHLSEYDSRNSNHLSNTATSYMKKDIRMAKDAASSLKHVADEMSKNRTKTEVSSARNMMNATAKAMETLKITARNYDKESKQSKGIKGTIDAAMGGHHNKDKDEKHDKKEDEKHDKKKDEKHDKEMIDKYDKKEDEKHDKKKDEKHGSYGKDEKYDKKKDGKHDKKKDEKHGSYGKDEKHDKKKEGKHDEKHGPDGKDEKHDKKKDEKHYKEMVDKYDKKEDDKYDIKKDEKHGSVGKDEKHGSKKDEKHDKKKDEKHDKEKDEKHEKKKDEKHEKKKDEKHGLFGKDYTHKDGGLLDTKDKNGGGILGSTDTVEVLVEKTLHDNFSLTALDHQITATEKALSPSMMERAKEKIHDVKEKLTGDKTSPTQKTHHFKHM